MVTLKLIDVGDSTGLILPEEILGKLDAKRGDTLIVLETKNGVELRPCDPIFIRQMEVAERVMEKERNVLQRLAQN